MNLIYLSALLVSILGLGLIDLRQRLALPVAPLRTVATIGFAVGIFLVWDLVGIALGIFFRGPTEFLTGITLANELPLEELFFLILLSYTILLAYLGAKKWLRS